MEARVAGVTVRIVLPKIVPRVAVMVAVPGLTVVARPAESVSLLTIATPGAEELQVTTGVRS